MAQLMVLAAAAARRRWSTDTRSTWQPIELVLLLFVLAIGSDMLTVEIRGLSISGSFLAIVLAMALLGPMPAALIGGELHADRRARSRRLPWERLFNNVVNYVDVPARRRRRDRVGDAGRRARGRATASASRAVGALVFMVTNFLNFAHGRRLPARVAYGSSVRSRQASSAFVAVLPVQFATGLLTAGVAFCYGAIGVGAVGLLAVVLFVFQYLLRDGHRRRRARRGARKADARSSPRSRSGCSAP